MGSDRDQDLVKTFGPTRALDGLDLTVARARSTASSAPTAPASRRRSGSCSASIAPTAARRACSAATRGSDVTALHRRIAYVPGDVTLWPNLSGGEAIDLLGPPARRPRPQAPRRADRALRAGPTKKGRAYSKGNRQKVALVAALASDADLLILDEPTSASIR
jgi:ABC-2 type transport system ATP-binding protein